MQPLMKSVFILTKYMVLAGTCHTVAFDVLQSKNAVAQVIYIYHSLPLVKITSVSSPALFFLNYLSFSYPLPFLFFSSFFWVMECLLLPLSTSTASESLCASVMIVDFRFVKPLTFLYFHLIFFKLTIFTQLFNPACFLVTINCSLSAFSCVLSPSFYYLTSSTRPAF